MFRRIVFPGLLVCLMAGLVRGQQTQPATSPATDLTTPKGALRALVIAMEAGDDAGIKRLFLTRDELDERMAQSMADVAVAYRNLRKAAMDAYGKQGAESFLGPPPSALSLDAIEKAQVTEQDGSAVVRVEEQGAQPVRLERTDGVWKVSMYDQAKNLSPEAFEQRVKLVAAQVVVTNELVEEIRAGKHPTAQEAGESLRVRLMQAAFSTAQQPGSE